MITCEFEDGKRTFLRHTTTSAIVRNHEGSILMVERALFLLEGGKWALPGGYLDPDESAAAAIVRECMEETGYQLLDIELFRVITSPDRRNDTRQNVELMFIGHAGEQTGQPDDESTAVGWFSPEVIRGKDLAFDHGENLELYFRHLANPCTLPLFD